MRDIVSEIKSKIDILTLVSEYVALKKTGSNYKGLSPFKPEKTPSFIVSPDKGIAYCFSTNKGGDIFKFLMEVENIEFAEALKILADKAGLELDKSDFKKHTPEEKNEKNDLLRINQCAADFFHDQLLNTEKGKKTVEYLLGRGLSISTITKFRLGYAPDSFDQTYLFLMKAGFTVSHLLKSGLALLKDTSGQKIYDRFRGRLIFPVEDSLQRVVGFGGRALAKDQEPKYLNSPETVLYQKSNLLYGFCHNKSEIRKLGKVLVVEGYMDMLASWQNGVKNVVAVNGTAFTQRQLNMLKNIAQSIVFGFDMDSAGEEATRRAYEMCQNEDITIFRLVLNGFKDLSEYAQKSNKNILNVVNDAPLFSDYLFDNIVLNLDLNNISDKKKVMDRFFDFFFTLKSSVEKDAYIKKLALILQVDSQLIIDEINSKKVTTLAGKNHNLTTESLKPVFFNSEEKLLGIFLEFRDKFQDMDKKIVFDYFSFFGQKICNYLFFDNKTQFDDEENEKMQVLALFAKDKYENLSDDLLLSEVLALYSYMKQEVKNLELKRLHKQLQIAESSSDPKKIDEVLMLINKVHLNG